MNPSFFKVGEHVWQVTSASVSALKIFEKIYSSFFRCEATEFHLSIELSNNYGLPFQDYKVTISQQGDTVIFKRADYLLEIDNQYRSASLKFHDELALKHAMMNLYSAFIVHHNWGLLIHSSCAVDHGQAHLFSGHSGAGKSTAARLSAPRQLLSDEATILKVTDQGITVFDSPFRSELPDAGGQITAPLTSIQLLHQALSNQRVLLKKGEGLTELIDKVFYWSYKKEETIKIMRLLQILINQVPVYRLHFQKNNSFWELISHAKLQIQR